MPYDLPDFQKLQRVIDTAPMIDGHFWIKRNGVDIDPHFVGYDAISCHHTGKYKPSLWIRQPADALVQKVLIGIYERTILKEYGTIDAWAVDFIKAMACQPTWDGIYEPVFRCCSTNALIERHLNGGELIFGSRGFTKGDNMWWEYGGDKWTVKQFLKKN